MPKYKRKKKKITDKCTGANGVWTAGENESGSFNSYSYVYVYIYTARTTQCICFFPSIFNILCIFSIDIAFHCLVYYCKISRFFSLRSRIHLLLNKPFFSTSSVAVRILQHYIACNHFCRSKKPAYRMKRRRTENEKKREKIILCE